MKEVIWKMSSTALKMEEKNENILAAFTYPVPQTEDTYFHGSWNTGSCLEWKTWKLAVPGLRAAEKL